MTDFLVADIERGKELVQNIKTFVQRTTDNQFALGELANKVQKDYGTDKLGEFAKTIGIDYDTLKGYRTTWRAWKDSQVKPKTFSLAKALASYKDRDWYIQHWPDATEKEAREDIREWKKQDKGKPEERKGVKLKPLIARTTKAVKKILEPGGDLEGNMKQIIALIDGMGYDPIRELHDELTDARDRCNEMARELRVAYNSKLKSRKR
jgi:hypothetical protein